MISFPEYKKCPECNGGTMVARTSFEDETYYFCDVCGYEESVDAKEVYDEIVNSTRLFGVERK